MRQRSLSQCPESDDPTECAKRFVGTNIDSYFSSSFDLYFFRWDCCNFGILTNQDFVSICPGGVPKWYSEFGGLPQSYSLKISILPCLFPGRAPPRPYSRQAFTQGVLDPPLPSPVLHPRRVGVPFGEFARAARATQHDIFKNTFTMKPNTANKRVKVKVLYLNVLVRLRATHLPSSTLCMWWAPLQLLISTFR